MRKAYIVIALVISLLLCVSLISVTASYHEKESMKYDYEEKEFVRPFNYKTDYGTKYTKIGAILHGN